MEEITLSVALATMNEENNLSKCLSSVVDWADEIVVVDGGSTDKTIDIAKKFGSVLIHTNNPAIFHINKQKALDACKGTWIVQLDADEIITAELRKEIDDIILKPTINEYNGYFVPRKNYFLGAWLKKGWLYPDYVVRIFRKGHGWFPSKSVHEQITVDDPIGYLHNALLHFTAPTVAVYWIKAMRYVSLKADEFHERNIPRNLFAFIDYLFFRPVALFFSLSIRHKGVLDGWRGIVFAFFSALQIPMSYIVFVRSKK